MLNAAEFDKFAEEYLSTHAANIKISGEDPDYFARAKIDEVGRRWAALKAAEPAAVLDFGAGIGNALPFLAKRFPSARITGLDVSEKSLAIAAQRFPGAAELVRYDGGDIPLPAQSYDLIFSACVFHHIDRGEHQRLFAQLKALLKPDGLMIIFEHNPINPVTRYIVATCPFDEHAVLVPAGDLKASQAAAGFSRIDTTYIGFFPGPLAALRPLERWIGALPIGAQYYTLAQT
jgi:SAM-dependent methyltransferase